MKLSFDNPKGLTEKQLKHIEELVGRSLPSSVKNFYKENAGSRPTLNGKTGCIKITFSDGWTTTSFIEAIDSYETLQIHLSNIGYLVEHAQHFDLSTEYVEPNYLFPIALLPNGAVYIAIDGKHKGKIYTADNGDFGIAFHSNNWEQFCASTFECC